MRPHEIRSTELFKTLLDHKLGQIDALCDGDIEPVIMEDGSISFVGTIDVDDEANGWVLREEWQ